MTYIKNTKLKLIESYLNIGLIKGFDNTSLQDLANDANIKKPSIFSHFKDYEDLKDQALQYCLNEIGNKTFEINPKAENAETLFLELINSFIDAFSEFPANSLLCLIDQKKTYSEDIQALSNRIDLMINSRFQVALDYCFQRSWTDITNTDEIAKLLTFYLRQLLIQKNMSDDDLSDMLKIILHLI